MKGRPETRRAYYEKMRADPVLWRKHLDSSIAARKNHPETVKAYEAKRPKVKLKARKSIRSRVYIGMTERGDCEVCGAPMAQGHHDDYNKPYEVRWLCSTHHAQWHKENPNG